LEQVFRMNTESLKGKKIAILGFSIEGLSVARFLDRHGLSFTILEKNEPNKLLPEAQEFLKTHDYRLITGASHLDRLSQFNLISRSQGIPLWNLKIAEAKRSGVEFTSVTKLFFDFCPGQIIGVTGTKGKGTTSTLIYEMLKASGFDVYLGGNIGQSPLDFIDKLKPSSWAVLELSSFQLEDLDRSPHVAVVLMVTSEHLASQAPDSPNYHRTLSEYLEAKKNLVRFQRSDDSVVINQDFEESRQTVKATPAQRYFFSVKETVEGGVYLFDDWLEACLDKVCLRVCRRDEVFLRGEHNLQNILAAATTALILKADLDKVVDVIKTFKGLEHRLEFVREIDGVKFYNDSFSTTPETAIAAIRSFTEPKIIILGGSDKGSDYKELGQVIAQSENVKAVILIGVTADKIKDSIWRGFRGLEDPKGNPIEASRLKIVENLGSMKEVVKKASELGQSGDIVLLSPACASFDMFKNYKDRGQQFKDCVNQF